MLTQVKKYRILFFVFGIIVAAIIGGKDTNYWGLKEKNGKQILNEIEKGVAEPHEVILTESQEIEIHSLILKYPEKYSNKQKSLVSKKTGQEILDEVEKGLVRSYEVSLNAVQHREIVELIKGNPSNYSEYQKSLVKEKTGVEILLRVGYGVKNPELIKLTIDQYNQIKELLLENPKKYTKAQWKLIPEIQSELDRIAEQQEEFLKKPITLKMGGREILNAVGLGKYKPEEIRLTTTQYDEVKELILKSPNRFNAVQKKLVPEIKSELKQLESIEGINIEIVDTKNMTGKEILKEVGWGTLKVAEIELTVEQLDEIRQIITDNPEDYNENQKSLIK